MKIFSFFKKKRTNHSPPPRDNVPYPEPIYVSHPSRPLTKSKSCYQAPIREPSQEHIYQVLDPYRDVEPPRFPMSHSYPQNISDRCEPRTDQSSPMDSILTPGSIKSSQSTSVCRNCQNFPLLDRLPKPVMKSASPRRHRTMIKTNPWISASHSSFNCKSQGFINRVSQSRDLVSPYATSEDLFPAPTSTTNQDTSIDSGIFDTSLRTATSISSSCSEESEEVSSFLNPPGQKRFRQRQRQDSTAKTLRTLPNHEYYLWRPYLPTNCSFQLPRSNVSNFLYPTESGYDNETRRGAENRQCYFYANPMM